MKPAILSALRLSVLAVSYLFTTAASIEAKSSNFVETTTATSSLILAQVTPDNSPINTQVNTNGNVSEITGGQTNGGNLFHSFQDFSVPTGNEAFFNNGDSVSNIFSRVTGGRISDIDGTIRANGSANLFLINPAGIIFGENARLDIGGSFYGSTASSILFDDGEFNAVDNLNAPILTVNAPIGLGFRDNPGDIVNRSIAQSNFETVGLEVFSGNSLAFLGGNLNFEGGNLTTRGGNIHLGGVSEAGNVGINEDGSPNFPTDLAKANITLTDSADIDVTGTGGGNITVNAQNLNLTAGAFGSSLLRAGIRSESTSTEAQAGNITIDVADNITLNDGRILNQVDPGAIGNSGNIIVRTASLDITNGGDIDVSTFGQGNAGAVNVTATGNITADGEDIDGFSSAITSLVSTNGTGNAGGVTISTNNLTLTNGGLVASSTLGQGNGGNVNIIATGDLNFDGEDSGGTPSRVNTAVGEVATGNGGGINISTNNLTLTNGADIDASTFGQGNAGAVDITAAGNVEISGETEMGFRSGITSLVTSNGVGDAGGIDLEANNITLNNGGRIDASTANQGNAGSVNINALGDINVAGESLGGLSSRIESAVTEGAVGNAAGVTLSTTNLNLSAGGVVSANTAGQGNSGAVNITAAENITIDGENTNLLNSGITSLVDINAVGNSGGITISTNNLSLSNGGRITASTFGEGNAGLVNVIARGDLVFDGNDSQGFVSRISSQVNPSAVGDAGGIDISANNISLINGGDIDASTFGQGNAGAISIAVAGDFNIAGESSNAFQSGVTSLVDINATGDAGGVSISTTNLNLSAGGRVTASTLGQGNAGLVNITATGNLNFDGEDSEGVPSGITSQVNPDAVGDAGGVTISTNNLTLTNGGRIAADTFGQGNAGAVNINATGDLNIAGENSNAFQSGVTSLVIANAVGDAGGVSISTTNLNLNAGGRVAASTSGQGNAGAINITATGDLNFDGEDSDGTSSGITSQVNLGAVGDAGGVTISTNNLTLTNGGRVVADTLGEGNAGAINITATGDLNFDGESSTNLPSRLSSQVTEGATGNSGGITVVADNLTLTNGGDIDASTFGLGDSGAVSVTTTGDITIRGENSQAIPSAITSLVASVGEGNASGVEISTNNLSLADGGRVSADTLGRGNAGAVNITARGNITADGETSNAFPSGITSLVNNDAVGNAGGVDISANSLALTNGGRVSVSTLGQGNAGNLNISTAESIFIDGSTEFFRSGITANALNFDGNGGNVNITTDELTIENGGTVEATNFDNIGGNAPGTGQPGNITIAANGISLEAARIEAATQSELGKGGIINLQVAEDIILRGDSSISAQAFGNADGGNLDIDARFIIAFPNDEIGNDIIATSDNAAGGDIDIDVRQIFGLQERENTVNDLGERIANNTNDIDASSDFGFDGSVSINTFDFNPIQGAVELSSEVVEPERTVAQVCQSDRLSGSASALTIGGKGGIPAEPGSPLNSSNISIDRNQNPTNIPAPVDTNKGKIQPARGVEVTSEGKIILTAYQTDNKGARIDGGSHNCTPS